ncbi:hypothetical protein [Chitinasiproducens palmae]|uniref:Uncharacterized protein n=1 Tax=Chitinasiproducens palmae TaxID=1770053 RepID=A0A1H2PSW2_9BURK|nr:hypothetical protein [Chitinasiproducens palmae]SDV50118.1 hypothetical protein SAMN05216551_110132 [Chitinasiproducens palmae]
MKLTMAAALLTGTLFASTAAIAQAVGAGTVPAAPAVPSAPQNAAASERAANEAAGLPDLDQVNRRDAGGKSGVELNVQRQPSFYTRSAGGTAVTEYRDRGKATEIDVQSGFGTRYQMSAPSDISPRVQNSGPTSNNRLPSVRLSY